jgi:Cof subfamily protein (haloacid dehalogenase superfamily)
MNYKLVAIDMDGTLLTPELNISRETVETVRKVIEKGTVITLSTGRMYPAALPFAKMLQLDVPIITCNGALTKCSITGKVYDMKKIDSEHTIEILRYCEEEGLSVSIYDDDEIFIDKDSDNIEIHEQIDAVEPKIVDDLKEVAVGSVIKIMFNSRDKHKLDFHARRLYEMYKDKLNFYFSLPYFVEIVNKDANKSNALKSLSSSMNINQQEIIAIGDNFNDLDMIKYAGLGVVMGNAPQYMKDEADFVTRSNDDDGVRYVLEKFILET